MIIGVPKEIKESESRVAIVPAGVHILAGRGHTVLIEKGAGLGSGISDDEFVEAGAKIRNTAADVYGESQMIVKVKEPLKPEFKLIKKGQILFTYFHFAASRELTDAMIDSGAYCFAYETLDLNGRLPLLTPMSEIAGRMAIQEGAKYLERPMGGRGILLGGVPGVEPGLVLILGGGVVGANAALIAAGTGARVTIMDVNLDRLRYLSEIMPDNVTTLFSTPYAIKRKLNAADLVVGAVLVSGKKAPVLVSRGDLKEMKEGSVIIDVAVDQGGCIESCKPTTHNNPTYVVDGITHYCVANMPGAVPRTSTYALTNATLDYAKKIADWGVEKSIHQDKGLATSANVISGKVTHPGVAESFGMKFVEPTAAIG